MLIGSGGRIGQECAHSALLNHPLGFVGRGKVLTQAFWPGMEARVRKNNGQLEAPSTQAIDADGTYQSRDGILRRAVLNRGRFGRDGLTVEAAVENLLIDQDLSTWNVGGGMGADDIVSGQADPAGTTLGFTLEDEEAANFPDVNLAPTIPNDSLTYTFSVFVTKNSSVITFPEIQLRLTGGTQARRFIQINTDTGASNSRASLGTGSHIVESFGDFWWVLVSVDNNGTGNTTATAFLLPTLGTSLGNVSASAVGKTDFCFPMLVSSIRGSFYIHTTGSAVTKDADNLQHDNTGQVLAKQGTGTLFMSVVPEFDAAAAPAAGVMIFDNRDGSTDGLRLRHTGGVWDFSVRSSSATTGIVPGTGAAVRGLKIHLAVNWAQDNFRIFENGKETGQDLSGAPPTKLNVNNFVGQDRSVSTHACSNISYMIITEPVLSARQIENTNAVVSKAA